MHLVRAFYEPGLTPPFTPTFTVDHVTAAFNATDAHALGAGAFGETWRITTPDRGALAVKIIVDPNYPPDLLFREIQGLATVASPHVVDLVHTQLVTIDGVERAALYFEFIDGGDLASRLQLGVQHDPDEVRGFARALLSGVAALHACRTVHRDIKPENIALRGGDLTQPVLLDLGLAKVLDQQTLTIYPEIIGTVPFMAPEQLRAEPARQLADVWAIGVVLHLMLTGNHPFYGPRSDALDQHAAIARLENGPRPLPDHIPDDLAVVVTRLLSATAYQRGSAARALSDLADDAGDGCGHNDAQPA